LQRQRHFQKLINGIPEPGFLSRMPAQRPDIPEGLMMNDSAHPLREHRTIKP
jgi:hypothetical protein